MRQWGCGLHAAIGSQLRLRQTLNITTPNMYNRTWLLNPGLNARGRRGWDPPGQCGQVAPPDSRMMRRGSWRSTSPPRSEDRKWPWPSRETPCQIWNPVADGARTTQHRRAGEWREVDGGHHLQPAPVVPNMADHGPMERDFKANALQACRLLRCGMDHALLGPWQRAPTSWSANFRCARIALQCLSKQHPDRHTCRSSSYAFQE